MSEFNRLAMLATTMRVTVEAEVQTFRLGGFPDRPVMRVRVIAP